MSWTLEYLPEAEKDLPRNLCPMVKASCHK